MPVPALIDASQLAALLRAGPAKLLVADCRYVLTAPEAGSLAYAQGHIPGAVHADLGKLMSGTLSDTGLGGRHPLPDPTAFASGMAALSVGGDTLVVAYDANDAVFASRLWWLLRWIGHDSVRVLDGGLQAWLDAGGALETAPPQPGPVSSSTGGLQARGPALPTASFKQVRANVQTRERVLVDARSPDRYRGENETLDPVGGHIPGALNRHFKENLDATGKFKPAGQLHAEFQALLGGTPAQHVIHQCGSGVSACHNLLAMEAAGLPGSALYPGSWSEWCRQPSALVALG